jgi:hypothetical protein
VDARAQVVFPQRSSADVSAGDPEYCVEPACLAADGRKRPPSRRGRARLRLGRF